MRVKPKWIILSIILFYFINNYIWLSFNRPPSAEDEFIHLSTSLSYYVYLFRPAFKNFVEIPTHPYWTPIFHITGAIFSFLFSPQYKFTVLFTNLFYFSLLLFSLFLSVKTFFSPRAGVFACVLLSLAPVIYGFSRIFMLEMAVTGMVALSFYVIFNFNNFHYLRRYLYLASILVIGALTKWTFFIFVFPLLLFLYYRQTRERKLFLLLIAVLGVISLWYEPRLKDFLFKAKIYILTSGGGGEPFSWRNYFKEVLFYLKNLIFYYWSLPLFILILFSFLSRNFKNLPYKSVLCISILFPLFFFSLLRSHNERHLIPVMVPMAMMAGISLDNVFKYRNTTRFLCGLMIVFAFLNYFVISFISLDRDSYKYLGYMPRNIRGGEDSFLLSCVSPHRENWKYSEILKIITRCNRERNFNLPSKYVIFSNDWIRFASTSLYYFDLVSKLKDRKGKFFFLPAENPKKVDYLILVKDNRKGENIWLDEDNLYQGAFIDFRFPIQERYWLLGGKDKFIKIGEINLPQNKSAYIFMRRPIVIGNNVFKIVINPQGINLVINDYHHYLTEFVFVDKPSHLISSFEGIFDYWKKDDNVYCAYRWYDNLFLIPIRIVKENNDLMVYFSQHCPLKEIFLLVYPSAYKKLAQKGHKYLDLNNSLDEGGSSLRLNPPGAGIEITQGKFTQMGYYRRFKG
jgi:hypothetical protein